MTRFVPSEAGEIVAKWRMRGRRRLQASGSRPDRRRRLCAARRRPRDGAGCRRRPCCLPSGQSGMAGCGVLWPGACASASAGFRNRAAMRLCRIPPCGQVRAWMAGSGPCPGGLSAAHRERQAPWGRQAPWTARKPLRLRGSSCPCVPAAPQSFFCFAACRFAKKRGFPLTFGWSARCCRLAFSLFLMAKRSQRSVRT